jgi:hypothetical protein
MMGMMMRATTRVTMWAMMDNEEGDHDNARPHLSYAYGLSFL